VLDQHESFRNVASKVTSPAANPPFRWEELDHSLVRLRLIDLADEKRISFDNRNNLNANAFPSLILNEERVDHRIRKTYEIYCDVWQKQGRAKSADFIRTVYVRGIVPIIHGRASAVASEFRRWGIRTSFSQELREAHLRSFHLKMLRLEDRWKRSLEAEAKECQYAARIAAAEAKARGTPGSTTRAGDGVTQKSTEQEKIVFVKQRGSSVPKRPISNEAWLNTVEELSQSLADVRARAINKRKRASPEELRELYRGTYLGKVANNDEDWNNLVTDFGAGATAKSAALVLLEIKTGVKRESIPVYCSEARRERRGKQKETA
jgi:hypothetical protein